MKLEPESIADVVCIFVKDKYGSRKAAAKAWQMSESYLSAICTGSRPPNKTILDDMGWTVAYVHRSSLACGWQEAVGRKAA